MRESENKSVIAAFVSRCLLPVLIVNLVISLNLSVWFCGINVSYRDLTQNSPSGYNELAYSSVSLR